MTEEHTSQVAQAACPPSPPPRRPRKARRIQTLGMVSFTALGLVLGAVSGLDRLWLVWTARLLMETVF